MSGSSNAFSGEGMTPDEVIASAGIITSEHLVKALKHANDPPPPMASTIASNSSTAAVPRKIRIAHAAWQARDFVVVDLGQLLIQWALEAMNKSCSAAARQSKNAKGKEAAIEKQAGDAPHLDPQYWLLVSDVLAGPDGQQMLPAIRKLNFLPLFTALMNHIIQHVSPAQAFGLEVMPSSSTGLQSLVIASHHPLGILLPGALVRNVSISLDSLHSALRITLDALPALFALARADERLAVNNEEAAWIDIYPNLEVSGEGPGWDRRELVRDLLGAAVYPLGAVTNVWKDTLRATASRKSTRLFLREPSCLRSLLLASLSSSLLLPDKVRRSRAKILAQRSLDVSFQAYFSDALWSEEVLQGLVRVTGNHKEDGSNLSLDAELDVVGALKKLSANPQVGKSTIPPSLVQRAVLTALPILLSALARRLRDKTSSLFPSLAKGAGGGGSAMSVAAHSAALQARLRTIVFVQFLEPTYHLLEQASNKAGVDENNVSTATCARLRREMLRVIEASNIYVPAGHTPEESDAWKALLDTVNRSSLAALQEATLDEVGGEAAVQALGTAEIVWKLEQEILSPLLSQIITAVTAWEAAYQANVRSFTDQNLQRVRQAAEGFLKTITASYAQSRDLELLNTVVFDAIASAPTALTQRLPLSSGHQPVALLTRSTLFSAPYTDSFAEAVRAFSAPTQVPAILSFAKGRCLSTLTEVKALHEQSQASSPPARKRQRVASDAGASGVATVEVAHRLRLQLQCLSLLIDSVPLPTAVLEDSAREAKLIWAELIRPLLDAFLQDGRMVDSPKGIAISSTLGAALRVRYSLARRMWSSTIAPAEGDDVVMEFSDSVDAMLMSHMDRHHLALIRALHNVPDDARPESKLELLRNILLHIDHALSSGQETSADELLSHSESEFAQLWAPLSDNNKSAQPLARWDGRITGLTEAAFPDAVWYTIANRWAALFNQYAPPKVQDQLAHHFVRTLKRGDGPFVATSQHLARDSSFFELPSWRSAVSHCIGHKTSSLDQLGGARSDGQHLQALLSVYGALEMLPVRYVPKSEVSRWVQRAWTLNRAASAGDAPSVDEQDVAALRSWIARVLHTRAADGVAQVILDSETLAEELLSLANVQTESANALRAARILYSRVLFALLHSAEPDSKSDQVLGSLHKQLAQHGSKAAAEALLELQEGLVEKRGRKAGDEIALPDLQQQIASLDDRDLDSARLSYTLRRIRIAILGGSEEHDCSKIVSKVHGAVTALHSHSESLLEVGLRAFSLFSTLLGMTQSPVSETDADLASQLFESVASQPLEESDRHKLAASYGTFVAALAESAYAACLASSLMRVQAAVAASPSLSDPHPSTAFESMSILLRFGPEGTSRQAHSTLSQFLGLNPGTVAEQEGMILPYLRAMEAVCRERVILLKVQDVANVLLLGTFVLTPNSSAEDQGHEGGLSGLHHASTSAADIFRTLCSILTTLVRQRQDLLLPLLPHLTNVLRELVRSFRVPAPGRYDVAQKSREKLPRWLWGKWAAEEAADGGEEDNKGVSEGALGPKEARHFARLLAAITTKSTSSSWAAGDAGRGGRRDGKSSSSSSASLANPFAHHASYVILAYLSTLLTGGTTLTHRVREELSPGLFALCDVLGPHRRDAMLVADLDAPGRMLFKALWKEWEAQRYRGA